MAKDDDNPLGCLAAIALCALGAAALFGSCKKEESNTSNQLPTSPVSVLTNSMIAEDVAYNTNRFSPTDVEALKNARVSAEHANAYPTNFCLSNIVQLAVGGVSPDTAGLLSRFSPDEMVQINQKGYTSNSLTYSNWVAGSNIIQFSDNGKDVGYVNSFNPRFSSGLNFLVMNSANPTNLNTFHTNYGFQLAYDLDKANVPSSNANKYALFFNQFVPPTFKAVITFSTNDASLEEAKENINEVTQERILAEKEKRHKTFKEGLN